MNVTAREFRSYLETFHSTLETTAVQFLPPDLVHSLFHLSFLPFGVRGYVSTQFGVAFEYVPSALGIDVIKRGRRIEDLFFGPPASFKRQFADRGAFFMLRDGAKLLLSQVSVVNEPRPIRLNDVNNQVTLIKCHFDALGWSRDVAGAEIFGNRSASFWSLELAVARAKDEVLAALVDVNKAAAHRIPIAEYVNTKKQKSVLVLGDYSREGMGRLETICQCVADLGYEPILVKDVSDIFGSDLQQKITVIGGLARFVLIDDSSRSGHLVEVQIALQSRWVTVLLHSEGHRASSMTAGLSFTSKVFSEQDFDLLAPCAGVERAVVWAESELKDLGEYKRLYPWDDTSLECPSDRE
jgi:hypothetical protein